MMTIFWQYIPTIMEVFFKSPNKLPIDPTDNIWIEKVLFFVLNNALDNIKLAEIFLAY